MRLEFAECSDIFFHRIQQAEVPALDVQPRRKECALAGDGLQSGCGAVWRNDHCFAIPVLRRKESEVNGPIPFAMRRVLKDGGRLILGTPDYGRLSWRIIETLYHRLIPGGYADEHITHHSKDPLVRSMEELGFAFTDAKYVLGSELILLLIKAEATP